MSSSPSIALCAVGAPSPRVGEWPAFESVDALRRRFLDFVDYAELVLGHSPATVEFYRDAYVSFSRFLSESGRAASSLTFDPALLEAWIAWLRSRPRKLAARSLKTYWRGLRRFGRDLAGRDGMDDPFLHVRGPNARDQIPKALPPPQCERILATVAHYSWPNAYVRARNVAIVGVALYAGLRKREIIQLKRLNVDLDDGVIHIIDGKGPDGGKNRTAYIPAELKTLLRTYLYERNRRYKGPDFFVAERTGAAMSPVTLQRMVERVRAAAGIHFSLHRLRHSFVTMLLRSGVPIHVASALAGHSDIATTSGYARAFDEDQRRFAQLVRFRGVGARSSLPTVTDQS